MKKLWKSRKLNKTNQMTGVEVTITNTMFILVFGSLAFPQGLMLNCFNQSINQIKLFGILMEIVSHL